MKIKKMLVSGLTLGILVSLMPAANAKSHFHSLRHRSKSVRVISRRGHHRIRLNARLRTCVRRNKKRTRAHGLRSRYRRSNNPRLLKRSGFINGLAVAHQPYLLSDYAPNDKRAVIPAKHYFYGLNRKFTIHNLGWIQRKTRRAPSAFYEYQPKLNGWLKVTK